MSKYSILRGISDWRAPHGIRWQGEAQIIEAPDYPEGINKAMTVLGLKQGDILAIIALDSPPDFDGYEVKISGRQDNEKNGMDG